MNEFSLLIMLVPFGNAKKIIRYARERGLMGATIMIAYGTVKSKILDFLGIYETRKELILTAGSDELFDTIMAELMKKFDITRNKFGIAFRFPLSYFNVKDKDNSGKIHFQRKDEKMMKSAIFTIINRGKAGEVVDASLEAGAKGGTIIHAKGSGLNQTKLIFDMEIEPEKEIVLTIVDDELLEPVVKAIRENSGVEKDGQGILFVIPISKYYGIK